MSSPGETRGPVGTDRLPEPARVAAGVAPRPPVGWQAPLLDLTSAVLRHWQLFLIVLSLGLMFGVGRFFVTRPYYRSTCVAVLMPREKPPLDVEVTVGSIETARDIANRGNTGALMLPSDVDLYASILRSDAVLTAIGERFASRLRLPDNLRSSELVHRMRNLVNISGTEEGMFNVEVIASDPALAADVANAMVNEMAEASKSVERQMLEQQVGYLKGALVAARSRLERDEKALASYVEGHGIVALEKQTGDVLSMMREMETAREVLVKQRLERLQAFTEEDHVARNLAEQIAQASRKIEELRERAHAGFGPDRVSVQEVRLRMEALQKQVGRSRDLAGTLESQAELWEIRARQPAGAITVIKPAIPLRERAGPSKRDTIGAAMLVAFILGIVVVMLREQWNKVATEPYLMQRAEEIRQHARMLAPSLRRARDGKRARAAAGAEDRVGTPAP
ncbi:MAG: hypothetical protein IT457_07490 [Planctomycetes bacterium]|nr:hypothetical protein [Planctomycetota bacterium]